MSPGGAVPGPSPARRAGSARYWALSRTPRYSLVFALPLLLLYEALAASLAASPGVAAVRNAADVLLKAPFFLFGANASIAFFATVAAVFVVLVVRDMRRARGRLQPRIFVMMLAESAILGLLLGVVVGALTQQVIGGLGALAAQSGGALTIEQMPWNTRLMLALGAGLYEELLFRVILVGGMAAALHRLLGGNRWISAGIAVGAGALIFSAFHYVGQYGDPWNVVSFTYRAIAGLVFSALYVTRGFGVTAWTHALYDVYVMLL